MKNVIKIAAVYIGLVIGAGFASGREVLEYFNFPSAGRFFGIPLSAALFMTVAYIILAKSSEEGIKTFDEYIESVGGRCAGFIKYVMLFYMFCGFFVMLAGSGALTDKISPLPSFWGSMLMALICFFVLSFDLKGIVTLNVILVPFMIFGIMFVAIYSVLFNDTQVFLLNGSSMFLSAICYGAYNTVTAGAVLVPLSQGENIRNIRRASVLGGFIIGLLILVVWWVQQVYLDVIWDSPLPMLEIAALCGKLSKRIYTLVLFMAICTTAVSQGFGIMSHFSKYTKTLKDRMMFSAVLCLLGLPCSLWGFSVLVENLYSFLGYVGIIWIIWIIIDKFK